jgi:hypothetical protein
MWNTKKNAVAFPRKVWGYGWSLNFGYPMIASKPMWKRALMFLLCLFVILLFIYMLIVVAVVIYYLLTPTPQPEPITIVLQ